MLSSISVNHAYDKEEILGFESVRDWFARQKGRPATQENQVYAMQLFTAFCGKNPDELRDERNRDLQSLDLRIRRNAEDRLEKFYSQCPKKQIGLFVWRAVKSFYRFQSMPLVGIKQPNTEDIVVRTKDHIPSVDEIRRMCDLADLRDRLVVLIVSQTGMRVSSLCRLQYKHVKQDLELGVIPCRVIIPLYEREFERFGMMSFICEDTVKALKDYLKFREEKGEQITEETWIFPRHLGETREPSKTVHVQEEGMARVITKLGEDAGIIPRGVKGIREFRFHCFRKRFQTTVEESNLIPLNWIDLMLCHRPRGSSASAYSRPSEQQMREAYALVVDRMLIYGVAPSVATKEDVEKQAVLKHYELGIEDAPWYVREKHASEIISDEEKRLVRPLTMDEKIELLRKEYLGIIEKRDKLIEEKIARDEEDESESGEPEQKAVTASELKDYLAKGWKFVVELQSGEI
ncbi:MAG: site-specific integrase, partial [archaeon]|nr:site-specific integrase [archaeon]